MLYIHDVWVNWFEGEENGYNVCHFHEWRKEDAVQLLDQVPLIKVEAALFNYIENNLAELPEKLLTTVYNKSYLRKNHQRIQLEYCFIISDGENILAVDTLGYDIPIRKSRLIPRQEQLVFEMLENQDITNYNERLIFPERNYHILSPNPKLMHGLTRKERKLKQLLFIVLDQLYSSNNVAEIRYWYTEWQPHLYKEIQKLSFNEVWEQLYDDVEEGWTEKHEQFCEKIIKGQPLFEKMWEVEQCSIVNEQS